MKMPIAKQKILSPKFVFYLPGDFLSRDLHSSCRKILPVQTCPVLFYYAGPLSPDMSNDQLYLVWGEGREPRERPISPYFAKIRRRERVGFKRPTTPPPLFLDLFLKFFFSNRLRPPNRPPEAVGKQIEVHHCWTITSPVGVLLSARVGSIILLSVKKGALSRRWCGEKFIQTIHTALDQFRHRVQSFPSSFSSLTHSTFIIVTATGRREQ